MTTTIKDVLKPFYKTTYIEQQQANVQLKEFFTALAESHPGWKYFDFLLKTGNTHYVFAAVSGLSYHPGNVQALCDRLGIETYEALNEWLDAQAKINVGNLIDIHSPGLDLTDPTDAYKLRHGQIKKLIKDNVDMTYGALWAPAFDRDYYTIPESDFSRLKTLKYILRQCPGDLYAYMAEGRDCEDFAFMLKAFMRQCGYGNLTICYVTIKASQIDGTHSFTHGINLAILQNDVSEYSFKFIEPQTDKIWDANDPMPWNGKKYDIEVMYVLV